MAAHHQRGDGALQDTPWGEDSAPWDEEDGRVDEELKVCYQTNSPLILEPHSIGPVISTFNFAVRPDMNVEDIGRHLLHIYDRQQHSFRINISLGMILRHVETGELRYFRPFSNQSVFDEPIYVTKRSDVARIISVSGILILWRKSIKTARYKMASSISNKY